MKFRRKAVDLTSVAILIIAAIPTGSALTTQDCFDCHTDPDIVPTPIDSASFKTSVHGDLDCVDCHSDVTDVPHETRLKPVSCVLCHDDKTDQPAGSFHQAILERNAELAPNCMTCHGFAHEIRSSEQDRSPTHPRHVIMTCGKCHSDPTFIQDRKIEIPPSFLAGYAKLTHLKVVKR